MFVTQPLSQDFGQNRNAKIKVDLLGVALWPQQKGLEWPSWCGVHNNGQPPKKGTLLKNMLFFYWQIQSKNTQFEQALKRPFGQVDFDMFVVIGVVFLLDHLIGNFDWSNFYPTKIFLQQVGRQVVPYPTLLYLTYLNLSQYILLNLPYLPQPLKHIHRL